MGAFESSFPWPVSPIETYDEETKKDDDDIDENDIKNHNLSGGSTENIEHDLKIFKKYLKIKINNELVTGNASLELEDNQDDLEAIKKQARTDFNSYFNQK